MKTRFLVAVVTFLLPFSAFAGGQVTRGTIVNMAINRAYGPIVFIQTSVAPTGSPTCLNSSWHFVLSLSNPGDKEMYAMLLTAYTTGALINIGGTGACSDVSFVESVQGVQLTN